MECVLRDGNAQAFSTFFLPHREVSVYGETVIIRRSEASDSTVAGAEKSMTSLSLTDKGSRLNGGSWAGGQ